MESDRGIGQGSLWTVAPTEEEEEEVLCHFQKTSNFFKKLKLRFKYLCLVGPLSREGSANYNNY
jgi:hypothetical protein